MQISPYRSVPRARQSPCEAPETLLTRIRQQFTEDVERLDRSIEQHLYSTVPLIKQLSDYIIESGGKRLRPMLLLIGSRLFNYRGDRHILLATIIEFIHTATLLHDDVIDASKMRRGQLTANQRWGNEASVLVGDFLYSRAFQMMVALDSIPVMQVLADTTNVIAEGEVQQLANLHNVELTERGYLNVIRNKTAKLFEAAGRLSAILCERTESEEQAVAGYSLHLGTAYQLIDDCLDCDPSATNVGKNLGDDLAQGKPTLPLLYTIWHGTPAQAKLIRHTIAQGGSIEVQEVMSAVAASGAIDYTMELAQREIRRALDLLSCLPPSACRDTLCDLAQFTVERRY